MTGHIGGIIMMEEKAFWKLIDDARAAVDVDACDNGDEFQDQQVEHLTAALRKLGADAVREFDMRMTELKNRAYRWDSWGAAYWLGGGCGKDGFADFRANLVSLGRKMYEAVLKNPDALAGIFDRPDVPYLQGEGFGYIPGKIYQELTGKPIDFKGYPEGPEDPEGEKWDFEDEEEVAERLPKLYKKLPEGGD